MQRRTILATLLSVVAGLATSSPVRADQASDAFDAWSATFLAQSNGQTFYSGYPVNNAPLSRPAGWTDALAIELTEDVYERTHTAALRQRVGDLTTSFLENDGPTAPDWCVAVYKPVGGWKDGWNDDLGWMITGVLHAYQITGNANFLSVVTDIWNCAYDRGWDTKYGAGGVWEHMDDVAPTFGRPSKCALSNDPLILNGVLLSRITGDASYLTKSEQMYSWMHDKLFDGSTGEVHGCWVFNDGNDLAGHLDQHDDNAYNDGTFLQSAAALYQATGNDAYYKDALLIANHRVAKDAVLHSNSEGSDSEWAYPFVKGVGRLATFNGLWNVYEAWMQNNATAAWSKRNASNVTWNDWTSTTPDPSALQDLNACKNNPPPSVCQITPLDTRSAAGVWQFLPQGSNPALNGTFELKNVGSALSLTTATTTGGGTSVVQEPFAESPDALWTFRPSSGGYYRIQNVGNDSDVSVESISAKAGAKIVTLSSAPLEQGIDQWFPVMNDDGTYSFYNLSSTLVLDAPGASAAAGIQFEQWFGNGQNNQKFALIAHPAPTPNVDAGSVQDGNSPIPAPPIPPALVDAGAPAPSSDASLGEAPPASSEGTTGCACSAVGARGVRSSNLLGGLLLFALGAFRRLRRGHSKPRARSTETV